MDNRITIPFFILRDQPWLSAPEICAGLEIDNMELLINGTPQFGDFGLPVEHKLFTSVSGAEPQHWLSAWGVALLTMTRSKSRQGEDFRDRLCACILPDIFEQEGLPLTFSEYLQEHCGPANA